jgi:signal transduction histidine kinase
MRILIVDDDADSRAMLRSTVEHYGCEARLAATGREALDAARADPPDIIVSDVLLPEMDGFRLLHAFKQDERLRAVPFVFYTAVYKEARDARFARLLGAHAYLMKPMEPARLWREIEIVALSPSPDSSEPALAQDNARYLDSYSQIVASALEDKVRDLELALAGRTAAEEEQRQQAKRLRSLAAKLTDARETERRAVARELHDEIGQSLTGLKLSLNSIRRKGNGETAAALQIVQERLNELIGQVRDLSQSLRPASLDSLGLVPTLEWHFTRYEQQTGIRVEFKQDNKRCRYHAEIELAAYRIVQEALTNAARYAEVDFLNVELCEQEGSLRITIADGGAGFDAHRALENAGTLGLAGMRERVDELGGAMSLTSAPDAGTRIVVTLPLVCDPADAGLSTAREESS